MKKTWKTLWCKGCTRYAEDPVMGEEEHYLLFERKRQGYHQSIWVCRVCNQKLEMKDPDHKEE